MTALLPARQDGTTSIAIGDVDGDSDPDLVTGVDTDSNVLDLNLMHQADTPYLARIGYDFQTDAYKRHGPPSAMDLAQVFVSLGAASISVPPLGTFGLDPTMTIALPPFAIPQPAGVGSQSWRIPNIASLAGMPLYSQALLVGDPFSAALTNVTLDAVLR